MPALRRRLVAGALLIATAVPFQTPADEATEAPPAPVLEVGEVTVTTTRAERGVLEVPGNVTVLDREQIERSGATHVADLLRREAGIYVAQRSSWDYRIESRGFNNGGGNGSSLLVLVDGRRVNEPESSTTDWSLIHLDEIERVEIVRGPASAVWGDNAIGGVIQIITRRGKGGPQVEARYRVGTFNLDRGSLFAGGSSGPVALSVFAEGGRIDAFRENNAFEADAADGNARWTPTEQLSVELAGGYSEVERELPSAVTRIETDFCGLGRDTASTKLADATLVSTSCAGAASAAAANRDFADSRQRWVRGKLSVAPLDDVELSLQTSYRRRNNDEASGGPSFDFTLDRETRSTGANLQLQVDRPIGTRRNRLTLGADYLYEESDNASVFVDFDPMFGGTFPAEDSGRRRVYGVYLQEELDLTERLLLSTGVRFDHTRTKLNDRLGFSPTAHQTFDLWSPKAALSYRLSRPLAVYASFARGFRFPNFDETFGFFGATPGLRPERSKSYELGAKWRSERASGNLALYWMDVKDEIFFNAEVAENQNFERIRHRGVELSVRVRPLDWLALYGSYTYDDTEIRRDRSLANLDGNQIPITPEHRGTYGALVTLPHGVELGLNANVVGSRRLANDLENRASRLPKYATYDATLALRPDMEALFGLGRGFGIELLLAVRNFTDREYEEFGARGTFDATRFGFYPAPGRHYQATVTLTWGPENAEVGRP